MFYRFTRYFPTFFHSFLLFGQEEFTNLSTPSVVFVHKQRKGDERKETKRAINIPLLSHFPAQACEKNDEIILEVSNAERLKRKK